MNDDQFRNPDGMAGQLVPAAAPSLPTTLDPYGPPGGYPRASTR